MSGKTKKDLVESVANETGLTKAKAKLVVNELINSIQEELRSGGKVTLTGFGTFQAKKQAARKGRNPQTGEPMQIPAKRTIKFTTGEGLKKLMA